MYVIGAITAWGAYFSFAKLILLKLSPVVFLIFRFGIGALVLMAMCLKLRKSFAMSRRDLAGVAAAAFVGIIMHQAVQLAGLKHTSATHTGWILTLVPPVTGLLGWIYLKERITRRQLIGLAVAVVGVTLFVSDGHPGNLSFGHNYGDLLVFASVFTWSVYTIITKARLRRYDPLPITTLHMALGFVFFLVIGAADVPAQIGALTPEDWLIVVMIGIVPSGLAYFWWNAGLKRLSTLNTSMFLFLEAVVATAVGFLLLGETFSTRMVFFAVLMVIGVTIAQQNRARRGVMTS